MGQSFRDPTARARWLIRLLVVYMATTGVLLVDSLFISARPAFAAVAEGAYAWFLTSVAILTLAVLVATGVMWIVWMYRCYDNVAAMATRNEYSKPWLIFGWIIPIGSLWIPFRMTLDLAVDPDPQLRSRTVWPALRWWWGTFILLHYVTRIFIRVQSEDFTSEWPFVAEAVLSLVVASLAINVVTEVTRRQVARNAAMETAEIAEDSEVAAAPPPELPTPPLTGWRTAAVSAAAAMVVAAGIGWSPFQEAPQSVSVAEVAMGDCTLTQETSPAAVVDCADPHLMQVVGMFDIPDPSLPDRTVMIEFSSGRCRELLEQNTGISGYTYDHRLVILSPTPASWAGGDRTIHCVIASPNDSVDLVGDLMAPSDRVPWGDLQAGGCYSFDFGFASVRPTDCATADLVVESIHVAPGDDLIATEFPGLDIMTERAERLCGSDTEWFYPDEDFWRQGDRTIVCSAPPGRNLST